MRHVFHVGILPIESSIEQQIRDCSEMRVLFGLSIMQLFEQVLMDLEETTVVVKGVIEKDLESRSIHDRHIGLSQTVDKEVFHSLEIGDILHLSLYEFPYLPDV
jgi:hypothetical protein